MTAELLQLPIRTSASPDFATDLRTLGVLVRADWRANPRDPKSRLVLLAFRLAQLSMGSPERGMRLSAILPVSLYRAWTEGLLGMELRPRTRVGAGLTIYHGFGIVVNDHSVIGAGVTLRNGVTIGNRTPDGACPVIGDGVELGAGSIVIGDLDIGPGARIGAGAVVVKSVPAFRSAVGNPARLLPER